MRSDQNPEGRNTRTDATAREAFINEPDAEGCHPQAKWRLRLRESQLTGRHQIEIRFRTRDGRSQTLKVDNSRRSDCEFVRRELDAHNARLPSDRKEAIAFVEELVRSTPTVPIIACASPGFCNRGKGFVMPCRRYGNARGEFVWDETSAPPDFGAMRGDLRDYSRNVLRAALSSPYLTFAILAPLASALLGYVAQRGGRQLLPETAIFHFAGDSSSGKTTLARVARSVFGSPSVETDYEASDRGIVEHAYRHNNLALIVDDTESAGLSDDETWRKMQKIAHQVPRGRGRAISGRAAKADLPELRWTCFGISSGPETFAELAARLHHRRHGDRVRMLDIRIPPVGEGGIFGSAVTASGRRVEDTAAIVSAIEDCILNCHGVLFHAWIEHLVTHDVVARVQELVDEFVNANAGGDDGLEQRFAKKFAVLYAAGVIGLEVGLLPWPENWPMRAVRHCYANSSAIRDPEGVAVKRALKRLARSLDSPTRFSQFAAGRGQYPHWRDGQIGLRLLGGAGATTWIAKHRLDLVVDPGHFATDDQVFDKLVQMKFIRPTDNVTGSRQFRVRADSGEPCKVRLWRLNAKRLREWALTTRERASSGAMRERRATTAMRLESRPHRARTTSLPRR